jgi:hypothetical protein
MAQTLKLRRSNTAGAVPTTGQMETGELAMNTADGKLFLKDNSSVRPIVTVDNLVTGSIYLSGSISASKITFPDIGTVGGPQIIANGRLNLDGQSVYIYMSETPSDNFVVTNIKEPSDIIPNAVLVYATSSGTIFYTASSAIGAPPLTGTPQQVVFIGNDSNPAGSTELTFNPTSGKFSVGDISPPVATTTNNPWNQSGYEATGSTIISEKNALITNATYTRTRFNLLGLSDSDGAGGVIGGAIPANTFPTAYNAPTPGLLPPPINLDDGRMGINGELRLGNLWASVYANGRTDVSTYGSFISLPGSPGIVMGEGGLRLFTSESMKFDMSGSLLTPKESSSIEFALADDSNDPALTVKVRNPANGTQVTALYISQSGGRPLIGVNTTDPKSTFDIRAVKDDGKGSEFVLQSTRTARGGEVGDLAGTISFTIDSGSFKDYKTSGSVSSIESEITSINDSGVTGDLILKTSDTIKAGPTEVLRINPTTSTFKSTIKTEQSLIIGTNSVLITNVEDNTISGDVATINTWVTGSYNGALYDYTLTKTATGARTGQFMVMAFNGEITYTDTSTQQIGGSGEYPSLIAELGSSVVSVKVVSGSGYVFKSLRRLI